MRGGQRPTPSDLVSVDEQVLDNHLDVRERQVNAPSPILETLDAGRRHRTAVVDGIGRDQLVEDFHASLGDSFVGPSFSERLTL